MALEENVATRLTYKAHTATTMTPNTELVPGTDPGASGGQELRRVASTLALVKDTFQSQEIRTDRQVSDYRHGVRRVQGEISGELPLAIYFPFYEAAFRATKAATFSKTNTDFTSITADNATSKLTVAASTWAAQNFRVGDVVRSADLTNNSNINFLIYSLSGVDAFVTPAPTTQAADSAFTISRIGTKITIPTSSHVKRLFAFEHFYQTSDIAQLFTECRIIGCSWQLPATGMATTRISVLGRGQTITSGGSAPFFTAPTAAGTDGIVAGVNGKVVFGGAVVGIITGGEITLAMAAEAPAVVGQAFVPEVFLGRSVVTGQITLLFDSSTFLDGFNNETEFELLFYLVTTTAANSPFMTLYLPRVKLGGDNMPLQGEAGLVQTVPFQALLKPTATGYDNTTIALIDSNAT